MFATEAMWLIAPPDGSLERVIAIWEAVHAREPDDPIVHSVLRRLYERALEAPGRVSFLDDAGRRAIRGKLEALDRRGDNSKP
jgi:hypothetical protein